MWDCTRLFTFDRRVTLVHQEILSFEIDEFIFRLMCGRSVVQQVATEMSTDDDGDDDDGRNSAG